MPNPKICVVVNGKLYGWDEEDQSPKEVDLVFKKSTGKISEEVLNALLLKMCKARHLTPEN